MIPFHTPGKYDPDPHRQIVEMTIEFSVDTRLARDIPGFPGIQIDGENDDLPVPGLEIVIQDLLEEFTSSVRSALKQADVRIFWREYNISPETLD